MKVIEVSEEKIDSIYIAETLSEVKIHTNIFGGYEINNNSKDFQIYLKYDSNSMNIRDIISYFNMREKLVNIGKNIDIYIFGLTNEERDICNSVLGYGNFIRLNEGVD